MTGKVLKSISILMGCGFLCSLACQSAKVSGSHPMAVDYVKARGRIYLDAAIDSKLNIHLVWMAIDIGHSSDDVEVSGPFYMKGKKLGRVWSKPADISFEGRLEVPGSSIYPRVLVVGDSIALFWTWEGLVSKLSTDGGESWRPEKSVLPGVVGVEYDIQNKDGILYLVYNSWRGTFFSKSMDFGSSWMTPIRIAQPMQNTASRSPVSFVLKKGVIHVVREVDGQYRSNGLYAPAIFYIRSKDLGDSWEDGRLINLTLREEKSKFIAPASDLKILDRGKYILISFREKGLSYMVSYDEGDTWSIPTPMPVAPPVFQYNICGLNDDGAIAFWVDYRNDEKKWWAHFRPLRLLAFDADPYWDNNDLFYSIIRNGVSSDANKLTHRISYIEVYYDTIKCIPVGDSVVVIWGGKRDFKRSAYNPDDPSEIFYRIFDPNN